MPDPSDAQEAPVASPVVSVSTPPSQPTASPPPQRDCGTFVLRALQQIIPLCSSRRLQPARAAASDVVAALSAEHGTATPSEYIAALREALDTGDPRVVVIALDCVQKLMTFGFLSDSLPGSMTLGEMIKRTHLLLPAGCEEMLERPVGLLTEAVAVVATLPESITLHDDAAQMHLLKALQTSVTVCGLHGMAVRLAVATVFTVANRARGAANLAAARSSLTQIINRVYHQMESASRTGKPPAARPPIAGGQVPPPPGYSLGSTAIKLSLHNAAGQVLEDTQSGLTVWHYDAGVIFVFLCEEAQRGPDGHGDVRTQAALDLIGKLVASSGPGFRNTPQFVAQIRGPLLAALLRCCLSPTQALFQTALSVFIALLTQFKPQLKKEVGVLFTRVVLRVLDSGNSSFEQRMLVLQALLKVVANAQLLVDLFLNYDCGETTPRVFGPLMMSLSKVVQTEHREADWMSPKQELLMKTLGLQNLVTVVRSLVQWMRRTSRPARSLSEGDVGSVSGTADSDTESRATTTLTTASGPVRGVVSQLAGEVERRRQLRARLDETVAAFNAKPRRGIALLAKFSGLPDDALPDPKTIARFLTDAPDLDKAQVGEYVGDHGDFNIAVLDQYCRTQTLAGLPLDAAARQFLSRFTLPKEGQKIERIMEYFSKGWYDENQEGAVRSAEAALLVAVGVVMLNTDLHNPQVENKMRKEEWIRQFRGTNDGEDYPADFLIGIFERVQANPMKDLHAATALSSHRSGGLGIFGGGLFASKRERKTIAYTQEGRQLLNQSQELFLSAKDVDAVYYSATDADVVGPMFTVCWAALLAAFSVHLEHNDATVDTVKTCIDGIQLGIHVAAVFDLTTEREAFVRSLCKLANTPDRKQLRVRQLDALRGILRVARTEAEGLGASWRPLLETVLEFERLRLLGEELQRQAASKEGRTSHRLLRPQRTQPEGAQSAKEVAAAFDEAAFVKVYRHTTTITPASLRDCVSAFCRCVDSEVRAGIPMARRVALRRLLQVVGLNMGSRLMVVWKDVSFLLLRLATGGTDAAPDAVNGLRSLVAGGLGRQELSGLDVQPELVEPFLLILEHPTPSQHIRDLVLRSVTQLTLSLADGLGEAWPTVMHCLVATLREPESASVGIAIGILTHVISSPSTLSHAVLFRAELVHCATFLAAQMAQPGITAEAVQLLKTLPRAAAAAPRPVFPPGLSPRARAALSRLPRCEGDGDGDDGCELWRLCLQALCFITGDPVEDKRLLTVSAIHEMVMEHGGGWPESLWRFYVSCLLPACALLPGAAETRKKESWPHHRHWGQTGEIARCGAAEWVSTTLPHVVTQLAVAPVVRHCRAEGARPVVVPAVCRFLCAVARSGEEAITLAAEQLTRILRETGAEVTSAQWTDITMHCARLIHVSTPGAAAAGEHEPNSSEAACDVCFGGASPLLRSVMVAGCIPPSLGPRAQQLHSVRLSLFSGVLERLLFNPPLSDLQWKAREGDAPLSAVNVTEIVRILEGNSSSELVPSQQRSDIELLKARIVFAGLLSGHRALRDDGPCSVAAARDAVRSAAAEFRADARRRSSQTQIGKRLTVCVELLVALDAADFDALMPSVYATLVQCLAAGVGSVASALAPFFHRAGVRGGLIDSDGRHVV